MQTISDKVFTFLKVVKFKKAKINEFKDFIQWPMTANTEKNISKLSSDTIDFIKRKTNKNVNLTEVSEVFVRKNFET